MPTLSKRLSLALALAVCSSAYAQDAPPLQQTVHFLTFENDARFSTDRFYTNGLQYSIKHADDRRGPFALRLTHTLCDWLACADSQLLTLK